MEKERAAKIKSFNVYLRDFRGTIDPNPRGYLSSLRCAVNAVDLSDSITLALAFDAVAGSMLEDAADWFKSEHANYDQTHNDNDWDCPEFFQLFGDRWLDPATQQQALMELQTARQRSSESLDEFANRLRSLNHQMGRGVSDEELFKYPRFVSGLLDRDLMLDV